MSPVQAPVITSADQYERGQAPGAAAPAPAGGRRVRTVSAVREYVSGGVSHTFPRGNQPRALPLAIDDITADFGDDVYDRMLVDAQVSAAAHLLKLFILGGGPRLENPVPKDKPRNKRAQTILEFCERNLRQTQTPINQILYELLSGMFFGYKLGEKIFWIPEGGQDAGKLCYRNIKVKPRRSLAFVVDAYLNLLGYLAITPDSPNYRLRTGVLWDDAEILPKEKFVLFNFRTQDSDPRGSSILRAAYTPWWYKKQLEPEYLKYLSQFAGPSLDGVLPDGAEPTALTNSEGQWVDEAGVLSATPVYTDPAGDFLAELLEFRNGTAIVRPFGSELNTIDMQGDGQPFRYALQYCNDEIVQALLGQTLATTESRNMARAASQTHQDVLDMFVGEGKGSLAMTVYTEILRPLVEYNFGPDSLELTPVVSFPATEHQDFAAYANAIANLQRAGFLSPSQLRKIDNFIGLPERIESDEEMEMRMQAQGQQAQMQQPGQATGQAAGQEAAETEESEAAA